jgi:EamA domain-containing membrane protein RarD
MLIAITLMGEPFQSRQLYGFIPIWAALAIYSADAVWAYRNRDRAVINR